MKNGLTAARRVARLLLPIEGELRAHWLDIRNRLDGYCCAKDMTGYKHWRCGLKIGHAGPHRTNNYTWYLGQLAEYSPLEQPNACVPRRTFSPTYVQRLLLMNWPVTWEKARAASRSRSVF
nr:hypothetical protein [Rhodococcus sp. 15-1154-1]